MQATSPQNNPEQPTKNKGKPVAAHGSPWQSVLTPYTEKIWQWRGQEEKTLREIAALLEIEGVKVAPSTVLRFLEARKRRKAKTALPNLPGMADGEAQKGPKFQPKAATKGVQAPPPAEAPKTRPNEFSRVVDEGGKVLKNMQYPVVNPKEL